MVSVSWTNHLLEMMLNGINENQWMHVIQWMPFQRCEAAIQEVLATSKITACGLDAEWADASGKVALLQIATRQSGRDTNRREIEMVVDGLKFGRLEYGQWR